MGLKAEVVRRGKIQHIDMNDLDSVSKTKETSIFIW